MNQVQRATRDGIKTVVDAWEVALVAARLAGLEELPLLARLGERKDGSATADPCKVLGGELGAKERVKLLENKPPRRELVRRFAALAGWANTGSSPTAKVRLYALMTLGEDLGGEDVGPARTYATHACLAVERHLCREERPVVQSGGRLSVVAGAVAAVVGH